MLVKSEYRLGLKRVSLQFILHQDKKESTRNERGSSAAQLSDSSHGETSEKRDPPIYALATFITADIERASPIPLLAPLVRSQDHPEG